MTAVTMVPQEDRVTTPMNVKRMTEEDLALICVIIRMAVTVAIVLLLDTSLTLLTDTLAYVSIVLRVLTSIVLNIVKVLLPM